MKDDQIAQLIAELNPIFQKYKMEGMIVAVGLINDKNIVDEAVLAVGQEEYLSRLLASCVANNPKMHRIIDNVAIAVATQADFPPAKKPESKN